MASLDTIERLLEDKIKTDTVWQNKIDQHLTKLNGKVAKHDAVLYGTDRGDDGVCIQLDELKTTFYKFRLICIAIAFFLLGTGVLSGLGLAQLL